MRHAFAVLGLTLSLLHTVNAGAADQSLQSPNGRIKASMELTADGAPQWSAAFAGKQVIAPSEIALQLHGADDLTTGFEITATTPRSSDSTYTLVVGKTHKARDHYNELRVGLREKSGAQRKVNVVFRAYDDALAFRYEFPEQPNLKQFDIGAEKTEFHFPQDSQCWALLLKGFQDNFYYEAEFQTTSVSHIAPGAYCGLPFAVQQHGGPTVLITEAHLKDYAGMYLENTTTGSTTLVSRLSPRPEQPEVSVHAKAPQATPWRVVFMVDQPAKLIESTTILNLNDPCAIQDTAWIKPGKTAWDWWSGPIAPGQSFTPGTNNETVKYFIDFASEAGLQYMLIDEGWYAEKGSRKKGQFDFDLTKTVPEIDLPMLIEYGRQRNVGLICWVHWITLNKQMEKAFAHFEQLGLKGVKVDFMDRDDQEMVGYYHQMIKSAADHHLLINFHGAYKPTGLVRTYPNFITQEGVMGAEYNRWSRRVTATHNVTLPFTRMAAGPMDYTPGAFDNVTSDQFKQRGKGPMVMSTRAQQLAMFVVYESPLQMLCDSPGVYRGQPGLEFLKTVPTTWDETRGLDGNIGQYVAVARRNGNRWFIGAMTNESSRTLSLSTDFLGNKPYRITSFADGPAADQNRKDLTTGTTELAAGQKIEVKLAPWGGFAAVLESK